jgi:hypothetical protein
VGLATGSGFADAPTGGAAMASLGQPLLLTGPKALNAEPRGWIAAVHAGMGRLELCDDGAVSLSGGRSGACSYHDGENHPVWKK